MVLQVEREPDAPAGWKALVSSRVGAQSEVVRDPADTDPAHGRFGTPREVTDAISSAVFLRLDAGRIAEVAPARPDPRIEHDGSGLAAVLAELALGEPHALERIGDDLRRIVPSLERVRIRQARAADGSTGFELLFDFIGGKLLPAHAVSEGTLLALAIITLVTSDGVRPHVVLLDDLEQALHPRAQWELVGLMKRVVEADSSVQIVGTSHSPYLVDVLEPEDILVCALAPDGTSRCRPLSSHPEAKAWKGVLSPGELLGAEGEDWVIAESTGS